MGVPHVTVKSLWQQSFKSTEACRSHFLFHSAAGLVSHPPALSLAKEPESPEEEEGRVTLSSMKMSQCGSVTARPTAPWKAHSQESLNNETIARRRFLFHLGMSIYLTF